MKFAVVTRVPATTEAGNMATAVVDTFVRVEEPGPGNGWRGRLVPALDLIGAAALSLYSPVFTLGEILILDGDHGRELAGKGRKPSKWDVDVETYDDVHDALRRGNEVIEAAAQAALAASDAADHGEGAEDPRTQEVTA